MSAYPQVSAGVYTYCSYRCVMKGSYYKIRCHEITIFLIAAIGWAILDWL